MFADGVAKPNSSVNYVFSDSSAENQSYTVTADISYKYPDSTAWNDTFASQGRATKYKDILSNWQTAVPFTQFEYNKVYNWTATASLNGETGNTAKSADFLVYKITRYDTLASIAKYYGVSVDQLATDNHVQDMLLIENNTIIVINAAYTQVLVEYGANNKITASYEYGAFRESAEIDGTDYFYEYDGKGSVISVSNDSGREITTYSYDAFGNTVTSGVAIANHFKYNGEYTDDATNLQYLRARYYRAETGSFITVDTYVGNITSPLSLNRYTYVHNNPVMGKDPSGHFVITTLLICAGIGAAIGGGVGAYKSYKDTGSVKAGSVIKGALIGGAVGAVAYTVGAAVATSATIKSAATYATAKLTTSGVKYTVARSLTKWTVAGISAVAGGMAGRATENSLSTTLNYKYGQRYSDPVTAATDFSAIATDFALGFVGSAGTDAYKALVNKIKSSGGITSWIKHFCGDADKVNTQTVEPNIDTPDLPAEQLKTQQNLDSPVADALSTKQHVSYDEIYESKKTLKSNIEYESPSGGKYTTNDKGQLDSFELDDLKFDNASRNKYAQSQVGKSESLRPKNVKVSYEIDGNRFEQMFDYSGEYDSFDGGHILGNQFGGSGSYDNLFSQPSVSNRSGGDWWKMEQSWRDALKNGSTVKNIKMKFKY